MTLPSQPSARSPAAAILFDLDGVLVDSVRVVERAWHRWAHEQGLNTGEVMAAIHGRRAAEIVQQFAPGLDPAEQVQRITSFELADGDLTLVPGALECAGVARRGRWAVVTSGGRELARQRLAAVGFPAPGVLVTADDVARGKPDPEPYLRAAEVLGVPPARCVVVEDAPAGVLAGKRAGMTVLAVTTTHPAGQLARADQVFPGMTEVAARLRDGGS